ncbi:MAG: ParB/RepB/Spo0J family partition protein [Lachnospiraceae bacterium]|nr:ParB/RepB/Spo0J family partition protein [Lachnospiraceae bacterium]
MAEKKKKALGRGLGSLFEDNKVEIKNEETKIENSELTGNGSIMISINLIDPNRKQPRKNFDEEKLEELAESIREHGIIEPLVVKKVENRYQIIAGERRWRAARKAKLKEVPVVIGDYSDREIIEVALIENIQREDLNPIEEAIAYKTLVEEHGLRHEEVAERVSKKRVTISNSIRLLKLDEHVQEMLIDGRLTSGHARCLLAIDNNEQQFELAEKIIAEDLSVRETEQMIRDLDNKEVKKKSTKKKEIKNAVEYKEYEKNLITILGAKVEVQQKGENKGKIVIPYNSVEEFEKIYSMIMSKKEV